MLKVVNGTGHRGKKTEPGKPGVPQSGTLGAIRQKSLRSWKCQDGWGCVLRGGDVRPLL